MTDRKEETERPILGVETALRDGTLDKAISLASELLEGLDEPSEASVVRWFLQLVKSPSGEADLDDTNPLTIVSTIVHLVWGAKLGHIDHAFVSVMADEASKRLTTLSVKIEQDAGGYPVNPISAKVWMDGASARMLALTVAEYFKGESRPKDELQMLFVRAKITNAIMSHYPHEVGPCMVDVGEAFERLERKEKAEPFFNAVILDFEWLLDSDPQNLTSDDKLSLVALIRAYRGWLRIAEEPQEEIHGKLEDAEALASRLMLDMDA